LAKQQAIAEEEARIKRLQEEEEARIRAEEEKEAEEQRLIEEEKERKRKAKQEKIEAQKQAGTYMTKAEKEKQKKTQARLEALKAAGFQVGSGDSNAASTGEKTKVVYSHKKKTVDKKSASGAEGGAQVDHGVTTEESVSLEPSQASPAVDNDDDDEDDWEKAADILVAKIEEKVKISVSESVEDINDQEAAESERQMRLKGLEIQRREEEARIRR
jgi:translation initiation factor 5B